MKKLSSAIGLLLLFSVAVMPQEKNVDAQKRHHLMEMMKDSTMVNLIIEHIAKDEQLSMKMMSKLKEAGRSLTSTPTSAAQKQKPSKDSAEVLVKFKPNTKEEQIKGMAEEIGMLEVKKIKELNLRVFKITSNKSVDEVIHHCQRESFVEYAEPNQSYKSKK